MTSEQRQRARDLFEAAIDRDPADVIGWLNDVAADDAVVREEVRDLLDHHARAGAFLTQPLADAAPHLLAEERTLEAGTVLGSYTVLRELGRGGMGRVYLASDARLGRTVALKALAPELMPEPQHRERLRREARAAASLTHPGICTVYALEEFDGELYIVTEYLEGHTLRDEIAAGQRPALEAILGTARELTGALASAHAKGISHRDLKPENVMRTSDGRMKILDFGLARVDGGVDGVHATATAIVPGSLAGTPAYMSPEQIEGRRAGPPADVFALGVLMYEWISGHHPFQAGTPLATLARVLDSKPDPLSSRARIPTWVSDVIDRCLQKAADARYSSAGEVRLAFDHPAVVPEPGPISPTWWRMHQIIAILLYIGATVHAWHVKEWLRDPIPLWAFLLIGIAGSVGGLVRGHLVFTHVMNRPHLPAELARTRKVRLFGNLLIAGLVALDALLVAPTWPLTAVLTGSLAAGIALASVLMEPATTSALLGE